MTIEQLHNQLRNILDDAYAQNPIIRHDPLFQAMDGFLRLVQRAIDEAHGLATVEAYRQWAAGEGDVA